MLWDTIDRWHISSVAIAFPFRRSCTSLLSWWLRATTWYGKVRLSSACWTSAKGFPHHHGQDAICLTPSNRNKLHLYGRQRQTSPLQFPFPPPTLQTVCSLVYQANTCQELWVVSCRLCLPWLCQTIKYRLILHDKPICIPFSDG